MPKFEHFRGGAEKSGKLNEAEVLGAVRVDSPEYKEQLKRLGADDRGYLPFTLSMELAMMFQPLVQTENKWTRQRQLEAQDPIHPGKRFPEDLRVAIGDQLGFESNEDWDHLEYYTAVGSPLDLFHGIDAFLVLKGKTESDPRKIATLDFTLKTEVSAKQGAKADIIVRDLEDMDTPDHVKKYLAQVDVLAKEAIKAFGA